MKSQSTISDSETIAALATPHGEGGIAVIRLSGPAASDVLEKMFCSKQQRSEGHWKSHHLYYGTFRNPQGSVIDHGLAVWMKAPRTYTGEDVVEFHVHGGRLIVFRFLEEIYRQGARPAQPGEFTQRAFLNGKMDLTQAEAVADMISAKSDRALQLARAQWEGELSGPVSKLRKSLLEILAQLEAAIDFPEEDLEELEFSKIKNGLESALRQMKVVVALVGKPNVGKSSLLNALVHEEAAIVHDQPGTTRDTIERNLALGGLSVRLVDTAGMRKASGEVEKKGIEKSRKWLEKADLVLALFDRSQPLTNEDFEIAKSASKKRGLFVLNKSDLPIAWPLDDLMPQRVMSTFEIPSISVSARTGEGLAGLERAISKAFSVEDLEKEGRLLVNQLRHKEALQKSVASLSSAIEAFDQGQSPELISADLLRATQEVGEIVGEVTTEHILDDIFSKFCIGK